MFEKGDILTYDVLENPPGIEIIDQLERLRYHIWTAEPVSPAPTDTESFHFPVSSAFEITTAKLSLPTTVSICLRDGSGGMIADVGHLEEESVESAAYILELGAQIKTYVEVEGPIDITSDLLEMEIDFGQPRRVRIGMRSRHERPATTVTTTEKPRDMMAAISTFGSALKSTSPERSYPTLRGHPPNIELGEELHIPDIAEPPETGVKIAVPERYEDIYAVAPLAYYLGAEVVPGTTPRLVTDDGFEYPLDSPGDIETGVSQTLRQLFTLDCVTRVDGLYNINLHERNVLEERVELNFAALYESSLAEQVAAYLSVPYSELEDCIPTWRLTAHVEPTPATIEQLPFVVNDLAIVQVTDSPDTGGASSAEGPAIEASGGQMMARSGGFTRSSAAQTTRSTTERTGGRAEQYVEPKPSDSLEQAWIGEGIPIGASKLTRQAFENWFDREKVDGDISITIVVNDSRMNEERDIVNQVYGDRDDLPFDIDICNRLTVNEFRDVLDQEHSFLHYIGHVEEAGFKCMDGTFDASTLESTGVDSFMLNACDSYQQGLHLIDAGAVAGIVTLNDVLNDDAVRIGETVARLLNAGFPLDISLSIAREESVFGGQYIVVGAGGLTVTQPPSRAPYLIELLDTEAQTTIELKTYISHNAGLGSIFRPNLNLTPEFYLSSRKIRIEDVPHENVDKYLQLQDVPVRCNDGLQWSDSISVDDLN